MTRRRTDAYRMLARVRGSHLAYGTIGRVSVSPRPTLQPNRPTAPPAAGTSGYRGDIDGLRAIAVTLVVLFHAGWAGFTGGYVGVDVFFVLSGFLITGLLMRELRTTGTISLADFYARRIRRLLPLSALVLVVTAAAAHFLTPALDRPGVGSDIRAAALYFANWHYAGAATQYMADTDKSPVLHYWSLSVEEQFYVIWPLLILLVVGWTGLARRNWAAANRRTAVALAVVAVFSFILSTTTSVTSGPFAYFGLHTRAWELAAGAALALAGPRLRRSPLGGAVLGWSGVALIVGSALVMTGDTVFPGTAAILPVGGAVMAVAAGALAPTSFLTHVLSNGTLRYIGRISYAWYLWHWPCLVLLGSLGTGPSDQVDGQTSANGGSFLPKLLAIALSLLLAVASHHLLENPARRARVLVRSRGRTLVLGVVITAVSLAASAIPSGVGPSARADGGEPASRTGISVAAAAAARSDTAEIPNGCYRDLDTTETPENCLFGDPAGTKSLVLAGDSNARFWFPAFDALAKEHHWKLYFWGKSGCPLTDGLLWLGKNRAAYDTCTVWRQNVGRRLGQLGEVDAIVLPRSRATGQYLMADHQTRASKAQLQPLWATALNRTVASLDPIAKKVVLMVPIPTPPNDVPACIAEDPPTAGTRCAFPKNQALAPGPLERAEAKLARSNKKVVQLDLSQTLCPKAICPAISGAGQVMYLNQHHLTAGYARSLSKVIGRELDHMVK